MPDFYTESQDAEEAPEEAQAATEAAPAEAGPPAAEAEPTPSAGPNVTFVCERFPQMAVAPKGKRIAKFSDGEFTTADRRVVAELDSGKYPFISRKDR